MSKVGGSNCRTLDFELKTETDSHQLESSPEARPGLFLMPFPAINRNNESGRNVCLGVEPVMNQRQHPAGCFPERAQGGRQGFFQSVEAFMAAIAGDVLHLIQIFKVNGWRLRTIRFESSGKSPSP
jgi:hypothetical protein